MDLAEDIIFGIIEDKLIQDNAKVMVKSLAQEKCCILLSKIKTILENTDIDDENCFHRIEELVAAFESAGSNCGNCHDFG